MNGVLTIMRKEVRDSVASKWLIVYALIFALLALAVSYVGQRNLGGLGFENFSRTTASLLNLCLLLAPLIALSLGAGAIAGERDRGTLTYLLAQPLGRFELLIGKFSGLFVSIGLATVIGFGLGGIVIATYAASMDLGTYLLLLGLVLALIAVMTGLGLLASVIGTTRVQALGIALLVWFVTVMFFDLVLIGAVSVTSLGGPELLAALLANPVEIVRVLAIIHLEPDLDVLGPFGTYVYDEVGTTNATILLGGALVVWTIGPLWLAAEIFKHADS
jgi:Cu-processing system permease protein